MWQTHKNWIIGIACLALALAAYYYFGGNNNGIRDTDIKQQLETLGRNQQLLTTKFDGLAKDLAQSQRRVATIEIRIGNAEAGVSEVAGKLADSQIALTESAGLIDANESILRGIRQRAENQASKP